MVSQISPTVIASATLAKREIEIMLGLDITNKRVNDGSWLSLTARQSVIGGRLIPFTLGGALRDPSSETP